MRHYAVIALLASILAACGGGGGGGDGSPEAVTDTPVVTETPSRPKTLNWDEARWDKDAVWGQ